jgi:hypothetical protein
MQFPEYHFYGDFYDGHASGFVPGHVTLRVEMQYRQIACEQNQPDE